jgi:hypothetical protein
MTLDELKQCKGFDVQVLLDGKVALGTVRFSQDGRPVLVWPAPEKESG